MMKGEKKGVRSLYWWIGNRGGGVGLDVSDLENGFDSIPFGRL
jgi:hypothetical protein